MYCLKGDVVFVSVVAVVVFNADDVVCCRAVNKAPSQYPYMGPCMVSRCEIWM